MDGIAPNSLIYLISEVSGQAIVVNEGRVPFAFPLPKDFDFPTLNHLVVGIKRHYRSQALGSLFGSSSILREVSKIYHRGFSVVLEHGLRDWRLVPGVHQAY